MEEKWITVLQDWGADTDAAVRRFAGDVGLYKRFLLKFFQDETMKIMEASFTAQKWDKMLNGAHTLKGVTGNLGLMPLFDASTKIVEALRADDTETAGGFYKALKAAYEKIYAALKKEMGEELT